jgi:uracil phosphoribosyltransferase
MPLHLIDHPVVQERLARLRSTDTELATFRQAVHDLSHLMCYEVTRDFETVAVEIETPMQRTEGRRLARPVVLVPILRAGTGMLHGFLGILSEAAVGYIGLARNEETHAPESYYCKLPPGIDESEVVLLDPMLATGGSAGDAVDALKEAGARRLRFACLIAAPEGVAAFEARHPEIPVYAAALDERLDHRAYILPGLGDAGDRYFGT